jgi:hypothetical protein
MWDFYEGAAFLKLNSAQKTERGPFGPRSLRL